VSDRLPRSPERWDTSVQQGAVAPFQLWSIWPMVFVCDGAYPEFPWRRIFVSLVDASWSCCPSHPLSVM
jgi:hypothetical protein